MSELSQDALAKRAAWQGHAYREALVREARRRADAERRIDATRVYLAALTAQLDDDGRRLLADYEAQYRLIEARKRSDEQAEY